MSIPLSRLDTAVADGPYAWCAREYINYGVHCIKQELFHAEEASIYQLHLHICIYLCMPLALQLQD